MKEVLKADELRVNVEKSIGWFRTEKTSIVGRFSYYEETYDGTESGWYKFRKDVAGAAGISGDNFQLEVKKDNSWLKVNNGPALDSALQSAKSSHEITVRVIEQSLGIMVPLLLVGTVCAIGVVVYFVKQRNS